MPLPQDEKLVETSKAIIGEFKGIFGPHPGFRPAHAKGALVTGIFTPSSVASTLSSAPHFVSQSTPIIARFSSSTGIPGLPDTDSNGNPRGLAIRFQLPSLPSIPDRRQHTDIITHAVDGFPASTPEETLAFFSSVRAGTVGEFLATHPKALTFIQTPKPFPKSFATEKFFSVSAFKLVSSEGKGTFVRYRIVPATGNPKGEYLTDEEVKGKGDEYLFDELRSIDKETGSIEYKLLAQVADLEKGDVTDDNTAKWPETREIVELGTISLTEALGKEESDEMQKGFIFDPIPRVEGVEASDDPLLELRAGIYLISGRERRAA
ncbi:catalase related subgroup domain-containing protein [Apodospora peruviana]|uniref:Catalase related subgroup domain-containing protein n=1 Tax=Apodospora peruviana TaxID=516989 RepID=A0AAE0I6W2_9PEZI|nr:catalase related subgroup domain-containing protein [Apodospora peruviana]